MDRSGFLIRLTKSGRSADLTELVKEMKAEAEKAGAWNYSMWQAEDLVFGYFELKNETDMTAVGNAVRACFDGGWSSIAMLYATPGNMREMYRVIQNPAKEKEGLYHRVFMTRLKPGMAEEYFTRHQNLMAALEKAAEPSDESSNFTIWNAGDFICGYNEMKDAPVKPEGPVEVSPWEVRMLEVMDWITDDVDEMFNTHHEAIRNLII